MTKYLQHTVVNIRAPALVLQLNVLSQFLFVNEIVAICTVCKFNTCRVHSILNSGLEAMLRK